MISVTLALLQLFGCDTNNGGLDLPQSACNTILQQSYHDGAVLGAKQLELVHAQVNGIPAWNIMLLIQDLFITSSSPSASGTHTSSVGNRLEDTLPATACTKCLHQPHAYTAKDEHLNTKRKARDDSVCLHYWVRSGAQDGAVSVGGPPWLKMQQSSETARTQA